MKHARTLALAFAAVTLYTTAGVLTFRLHEARFPGPTPQPTKQRDNASEVMGVLWPIGLPVTVGVLLADQIP